MFKPMRVAVMAVSFSLLSFTYAQQSEVVVPKLDEKISRASFLRDKLSDDAMFYARIPSQFGMAFSQKNKATDVIMENAANEKAVLQLKKMLQDPSLVNEAIAQYVSGPLYVPFDIGEVVSFIYTSVNGPIEVMAMDKNKAFSPNSQVLVTVPVNFRSTQELAMAMSKITAGELTVVFDADGFYKIDRSGSLYFDAKDQRLYLSLGATAMSASEFKSAVNTLKQSIEHRMYAYENQIDLTGQNFFIWTDIQGSRDMASLIWQNDAPFMKDYVLNTEGVAVGVGTTANGLGQLKLLSKTQTDQVPWLSNNIGELDFNSVGTPKSLVTLALPSKAFMEQYIVAASEDDEMPSDIADVSDELLSLNVLDVLDVVGPQVMFYEDDTGVNGALKIKDTKRFNELLAKITNNADVTHRVHNGIHELRMKNPLPKLLAMTKPGRQSMTDMAWQQFGLMQPMSAEWVSALYGVRAMDAYLYLYWKDEGNWIVMNTLPYGLLERNNAKTSVSEWLNDQDVDASGLIMSYTGTVKNAEESWYRDYLKFLRNNYDILGKKFDLFSMPAPSTIKFKDTSRIGFHVAVDTDWVIASIDYDVSPFYTYSLLGGQAGGLTAMSAIGIASMFALPAYQDYTKRTYVAEGMALATAAKMASTEVYSITGAWPENNDEAGLPSADIITGQGVDGVEIVPNGNIMIHYNDKVGSGYLVLQGIETANGSSVRWQCRATDLDYKLLPANCRNEVLNADEANMNEFFMIQQ